jgi:hypothetical protein
MRHSLIVRLSGKTQYEIADSDKSLLDELGTLDAAAVALLNQTESELQRLLGQMASAVETHGSILQNKVVPSDLILPPVDLTLAEAAKLFQGEGLIPEPEHAGG